jgi:hypothetical protein
LKRLLVGAALAVGVAGCALIIDLGDEPKLAPPPDSGPAQADTGGPVETPDTGVDAAPVYACGLPPSANADCAACISASCCDVSKACAADPRCVEGLDCIKHCLVQVGCVNKCLADFPEVQNEATCSAFQCPKCTPGPECAKLGKCVFDLPQDSLLRLAQEGRILNLDDAVCKTARQQVASDGTADAGACFDP